MCSTMIKAIRSGFERPQVKVVSFGSSETCRIGFVLWLSTLTGAEKGESWWSGYKFYWKLSRKGCERHIRKLEIFKRLGRSPFYLPKKQFSAPRMTTPEMTNTLKAGKNYISKERDGSETHDNSHDKQATVLQVRCRNKHRSRRKLCRS